MPEEDNRGRESRGKSQEPKARSKSRGGGGSRTKTTTTTTTETPASHRGKGGGEQHNEHHEKQHQKKEHSLKELKELVAKKEADAAKSRETQLRDNAEIDEHYKNRLEARLLQRGQNFKDAYDKEKQNQEEQWNKIREADKYINMKEEDKKEYDQIVRKDINAAMRRFLKEQKCIMVPSKQKVAKAFYDKRKKDKANSEAPKGPHMHHETHKGEHNPKINPDSDELQTVPGGPTQAQMRYDPTLWGAATHTRARDSLRYL